MRDLGLKTLSLLIALGLFLFVRSESNTSVITFLVPVEIKNLPKDRLLLLPENTEAEVSIRGPSFLLTRVYSTPPSFKVVVPDDATNVYRAQLKEESLNLPPSIRVLKIDPPEVELVMDKRVIKTVKVKVSTIGSAPAGVQLESIEANPSEVSLEGAESELKDLLTVESVPVELGELDGDETREVRLNIPGRHTKAQTTRVQVHINVQVQNSEKHTKVAAQKEDNSKHGR